MRVRLVGDPRAEVGEDVRVGVAVRVGPVEFQLYYTGIRRIDPQKAVLTRRVGLRVDAEQTDRRQQHCDGREQSRPVADQS